MEVMDEGFHNYFNDKIGRNYLDLMICVIWIVLFLMRLCFVIGRNADNQTMVNTYALFFALQMVILAQRFLMFFANSVYLGPMLRTIKLMFIEIYKFLFIF
eukprot:344112_1